MEFTTKEINKIHPRLCMPVAGLAVHNKRDGPCSGEIRVGI
jgi:hypothetical protein